MRPWLLWAPSLPCWAPALGWPSASAERARLARPELLSSPEPAARPPVAQQPRPGARPRGLRSRRLAMIHFDLHLVAFNGHVLLDDGQDLVPERLNQLGSTSYGPLVREQDLEPVPRG